MTCISAAFPVFLRRRELPALHPSRPGCCVGTRTRSGVDGDAASRCVTITDNFFYWLFLVDFIHCYLLECPETMVTWKTVHEIARHLRTSPSTVYKLKERGVIRGYRAGRTLLFDPDEVDEDIKRANKKPPPTKG